MNPAEVGTTSMEILQVNKPQPLVVRPALFIFTWLIFFFSFIFANGIALSLVRLPLNANVIFVLTFAEILIVGFWTVRQPLRLIGEPLEFAGFLLVVVGVWGYFIYPSLPTLLPPTLSGDGANHVFYVQTVFNTEKLFETYPVAPSIITATLAHWIGWSPLQMVHLMGATWIALIAGGIYGITCAILPDQARYKTIALFSILALFVPWDYFAGILLEISYFWINTAGHLLIIAFIWFLTEYLNSHHPLWAIAMGMVIVVMGNTYPVWLLLPIALFVWGMFMVRQKKRELVRLGVTLSIAIIVLAISIVATEGRFLPSLQQFRTGGVILPPTFERIGGWFLILPMLGLVPMLRRGYRPQIITVFLIIGTVQTLAIGVAVWHNIILSYWIDKSFYFLIFPLAPLATIPLARIGEWLKTILRRPIFSNVFSFGITGIIVTIAILAMHFPRPMSPLNADELAVALWAKENIADTTHINLIGRRSLQASWLGHGIWDEVYPNDLFVDLAALGPKTFEEWRDDPSWGEYLFVPSGDWFASDPAVRTVYQRGDSSIVQKRYRMPAQIDATPLGKFGETFALLDADLSQRTFHAGDSIRATVQVETLRLPTRRIVWRLGVRDLQDQSVAEATLEPFDGKFQLDRWSLHTAMTQTMMLKLPNNIPPGVYYADLGLYYLWSGDPLSYQPVNGSPDNVKSLERIKVALPPAPSNELDQLNRVTVQVGESFTLLGYQLPKPVTQAGESFALVLYWQSKQTTPKDYTVFVHLLDSTGVVRAQHDSAPRNATYPTSAWEVGEIIPDTYSLTLPNNLEPGEYRIEIGMYEWPSLQRLPVLDVNRVLHDYVVLPTTVTIK